MYICNYSDLFSSSLYLLFSITPFHYPFIHKFLFPFSSFLNSRRERKREREGREKRRRERGKKRERREEAETSFYINYLLIRDPTRSEGRSRRMDGMATPPPLTSAWNESSLYYKYLYLCLSVLLPLPLPFFFHSKTVEWKFRNKQNIEFHFSISSKLIYKIFRRTILWI